MSTAKKKIYLYLLLLPFREKKKERIILWKLDLELKKKKNYWGFSFFSKTWQFCKKPKIYGPTHHLNTQIPTALSLSSQNPESSLFLNIPFTLPCLRFGPSHTPPISLFLLGTFSLHGKIVHSLSPR